MTSIVLVTLGVLLAAVAALMVVYYGGDAYNSANARAAANTLVNAGENVRHAVERYRMQEGGEPAAPATLVSAAYMSSAPDFGTLGRAAPEWRDVQGADGLTRRSYVVEGVDARICVEVAGRSGGSQVGCVERNGEGVFYARI